MMNKVKKYVLLSLLISILFNCREKQAPDKEIDKRDTDRRIAPIEVPFDMPAMQPPRFPDREFNIVDHGAKAMPEFNNAGAINEAIKACSEAGGGKVVIPSGTWLSGSIHLQSNVNLHLESGSKLTFSDDFEDYLPVVYSYWEGIELYNYSAPIYARDCENIAITGGGAIHGNGQIWWDWDKDDKEDNYRLYEMALSGIPVEERIFGKEETLRPNFVQLMNCKNVFIEGPSFHDGPMWTIVPVYCEHVIIRDIKVYTDGPNTDGINPCSSKNVLIEGCYFETGDDCVVIKSGLNEEGWRVNKPCENVVVRNCEVAKGYGGFTIGSEMSGGVNNIIFKNCHIKGARYGLRIKSMRGRGGYVKNVWYENISMDSITRQAILVNMFYPYSTIKPKTDSAGVFDDIYMNNISVDKAGKAVHLIGLPESNIRHISLKDIEINAQKGPLIKDVQNIYFYNVNVQTDLENLEKM